MRRVDVWEHHDAHNHGAHNGRTVPMHLSCPHRPMVDPPYATLFASPAFRSQAQIVCQTLLEILPALTSAESPWKLPAFDTVSQDPAA